MVIAFDFDGTLTNKDTLCGFFLQTKTPFYLLKIILYFIVMIAAKFKVISNSQLKAIGILFFLRGKSKLEIEQMGKDYAQTIKLNDIYYQYYKPLNNAWIISASFYEYLQFIFPKQTIIASQLDYNDKGLIKGLKLNCYGDVKLTAIQKRNINQIDVFYTDNLKTDKSIVEITEKTFLVNKGMIIKSKK